MLIEAIFFLHIIYNTCTYAHESRPNYTVDTVESESKFNIFPQTTKNLRENVYGCASALKMFEMKINIKSKCSSRNQIEKHPAANPNPQNRKCNIIGKTKPK